MTQATRGGSSAPASSSRVAPGRRRGRGRRAGLLAQVEGHDLVTVLDEPLGHVGAHLPKSDHCDLHGCSSALVTGGCGRGGDPGQGRRRGQRGRPCARGTSIRSSKEAANEATPSVSSTAATSSMSIPASARPVDELVGPRRRRCRPCGPPCRGRGSRPPCRRAWC